MPPRFDCIFIPRHAAGPLCKEWFDLFNRSGLREWDNKWEASKGKTAMEGGREARSFCNLGGKRASERDKGRLIMSDAAEGTTRIPSSSPVILIIVTKGA